MNFILQWFLFFFEYLISLIIIIYLAQLLHETGKIIFARFSGYQFVSLNFMWFTLLRKNKKLKFYFHRSFFDTSSNVVPSKFTPKMKFRPYFFGGIILDLIFLIISILILLLVPVPNVLFRVDNLLFIFFFFYNFLNIIPITWFGNPTDTKNISYIKKGPDALFGYYVSLVAVYLAVNNVPIVKYSEDLFRQNENADHRNPFVMYQDWLKVTYLEHMIFRENANYDLLQYLDALIPFLNFAPKMIRAQYLNEAIFVYVAANYKTKWAIDHWNSSLITHYSTRQNYTSFIKTMILIEIINKKDKLAQDDLKEGARILEQASDQINDLYLVEHLESDLPKWRDQLNFNHVG
ncbi:hypothetical protein [Xylocopilactobacillus apicola]|uniref:hypothetical protein n=1 Tax=Xylocopilactobacillus apicola TaxID=2932184 RepID=UPI002954FFBB|nr:hypothetical protein [Xylocopilactobacillus apicola]